MIPASTNGGGTCATAGPIDACKTPTPGGPVPMPYPNIAQNSQVQGSSASKKVKICNKKCVMVGTKITMSSGLGYHVTGNPLHDGTRTYYAPDLRRVALQSRVEEAPGARFWYNNYNALLLGMVLERATKMSVSEYLETRLWQPMGAQGDGSWSLDSERSGFEKRQQDREHKQ